jgi:hypothetical protein
MLAVWKALDTQYNYLDYRPIGREDVDDHYKDYLTDTNVRPKQAIYWPNFVIRRRRKRLNCVGWG